jgi:hypothetical protein
MGRRGNTDAEKSLLARYQEYNEAQKAAEEAAAAAELPVDVKPADAGSSSSSSNSSSSSSSINAVNASPPAVVSLVTQQPVVTAAPVKNDARSKAMRFLQQQAKQKKAQAAFKADRAKRLEAKRAAKAAAAPKPAPVPAPVAVKRKQSPVRAGTVSEPVRKRPTIRTNIERDTFTADDVIEAASPEYNIQTPPGMSPMDVAEDGDYPGELELPAGFIMDDVPSPAPTATTATATATTAAAQPAKQQQQIKPLSATTIAKKPAVKIMSVGDRKHEVKAPVLPVVKNSTSTRSGMSLASISNTFGAGKNNSSGDQKALFMPQTQLKGTKTYKTTVALFNLDPDTTMELLEELLNGFGVVDYTQDVAKEDEQGEEVYSHTLIKFREFDSAETAIVVLNDSVFNGNVIGVDWSEFQLEWTDPDAGNEEDNHDLADHESRSLPQYEHLWR